MLGPGSLGDVDERGDERLALAVHETPDQVVEQTAVELFASHAGPIHVCVAHFVAREQTLLEQALERRLDRVERDAAALAERDVHCFRFAVASGPEVVHDGGFELTERTGRGHGGQG